MNPKSWISKLYPKTMESKPNLLRLWFLRTLNYMEVTKSHQNKQKSTLPLKMRMKAGTKQCLRMKMKMLRYAALLWISFLPFRSSSSSSSSPLYFCECCDASLLYTCVSAVMWDWWRVEGEGFRESLGGIQRESERGFVEFNQWLRENEPESGWIND